MKLSTQGLAMASARHPWRTIGAWAAVLGVAVVAIVALLGGALTTKGNPTNNPQSQRAKAALSRAFPPTVSGAVTDIVVVRSQRYTVDAPQFRALVRALGSDVRRAGGVDSVRTFLDAR
ncbi:MAG: putative drug exporter of the superfamily, partial [Gaiellaceae bacterium]|nr:putative drug exporter of the superfamily [Gaiellaceae bacterium]